MATRPAHVAAISSIVSLKEVHQFIDDTIYSLVGGVLVAGNPKAYPIKEPNETGVER
jgi:hypothetical protein